MSSSTETATSAAPARQPNRTGQAYYRNVRLISSRRIRTADGSMFLTLIKEPNPDDFETGSTLEVSSRQRLGDPGDTWSGWVRLRGYPRQYKATEPETGESVIRRTADVRLYVIED